METSTKSRYSWKKLLGIALLIGVLQIPVNQIYNLTSERQQLRDAVNSAIPQVMFEPVLFVPYNEVQPVAYEFDPAGQIKPTVETQPKSAEMLLTLQNSNMLSKVETQKLKKGIHTLVGYKTNISWQGDFSSLDQYLISPIREVKAEDIKLLIGFARNPDLSDGYVLKFGIEQYELKPSRHELPGAGYVMETSLDLKRSKLKTFNLEMTIRDKQSIEFATVSELANLSVTGDWSAPAFIGKTSPIDRLVSGTGFESVWRIRSLGEFHREIPRELFNQYMWEKVGINLMEGIDHYRVIHRVIRYQLFFFGLIFITFTIIELLKKIAVHPIQYLLIGAALCLFYLVLLSFAEQFGITIAYCIAALFSSTLIGGYSSALLRDVKQGLLIGVSLLSAYATLFVIIRLEELALIVGTVVLMIILSALMYKTRKIDWYQMEVRV
jgi:inner membrane protein